MSGRVSYSYQHTENQDTKDSLSNSPNHLAKLSLIAPLIKKRVYAGLEVLYTGKRDTLSGGDTSDFSVTNLTLFAPQLYPGLDLSFSVYNLFDKKYHDPASEEHTQDAIEQDGRLFRAKLNYAF